MKLAPVIGLETHLALKTKSKLFSGPSNNSQNTAPNVNISAICLGHPGVLPTPNEEAIRFSILLGLALNGEIATETKFDRKHYFYPDLPKGYQISQFDQPVMSGGSVVIDVPGVDQPITIKLERMHLEEDAAKNIHGDDGKTYVDYNRAGTPLCEIVTQPVISSAAEAKAYLQAIRLLARTLGISNADMEKGEMRCDVNISMREVNEDGSPVSNVLHPKTEIKNVNSFKAVERSIAYEIKRQTELWGMKTPPSVTTTRGWDDTKQKTIEHRIKEGLGDYRFFPEPDIPPMNLTELTDEIKNKIPELPRAKRLRFMEEYGFKLEDVNIMIESKELAGFVEHAMSELGAWLKSDPDINEDNVLEERKKFTKLFSAWLLNKLSGLLTDRKIGIKSMKITPENFAELIILLSQGKLTGPSGLKVLNRMLDDGSDPSHAMEELGATRLDDASALQIIVEAVIADNPKEVERYKNGEKKLMQFFLGQIMKETKGNADPQTSARLIADTLG